MHPERDAGTGHDLGQEPRAPAALHHADDGHHAQTGNQSVRDASWSSSRPPPHGQIVPLIGPVKHYHKLAVLFSKSKLWMCNKNWILHWQYDGTQIIPRFWHMNESGYFGSDSNQSALKTEGQTVDLFSLSLYQGARVELSAKNLKVMDQIPPSFPR